MTAIVLDGCDDDAMGDLAFGLLLCPGSTADCAIYPAPAGAKTSGTPGCARFSGAIPPGPIVDRRNDTYFVALAFGSTGTTLKARAVRVFYRLRLSDGPAIPSFGHVPTTHLFYGHARRDGRLPGESARALIPFLSLSPSERQRAFAKSGWYWPYPSWASFSAGMKRSAAEFMQ